MHFLCHPSRLWLPNKERIFSRSSIINLTNPFIPALPPGPLLHPAAICQPTAAGEKPHSHTFSKQLQRGRETRERLFKSAVYPPQWVTGRAENNDKQQQASTDRTDRQTPTRMHTPASEKTKKRRRSSQVDSSTHRHTSFHLRLNPVKTCAHTGADKVQSIPHYFFYYSVFRLNRVTGRVVLLLSTRVQGRHQPVINGKSLLHWTDCSLFQLFFYHRKLRT